MNSREFEAWLQQHRQFVKAAMDVFRVADAFLSKKATRAKLMIAVAEAKRANELDLEAFRKAVDP